jgi:cysteine desulfurase
VLERMMPYLTTEYGNASSAHSLGGAAGAAVNVARQEVAETIGASPEEITFVSGATEADNTALLGCLRPRERLITAATEHEAILETARYAESAGAGLTVLPVDERGIVSPEALRKTLAEGPPAALVSIMLANNETGTVNPVAELAEVAHEHGVPFHTDAAQAPGKIPVDVEELGVDLLSLSAHKFYGPKGIGALYVRRRHSEGVRRTHPEPLLRGGGQERGLRSGTLNVPGIVGMGRAATLASEALGGEAERIAGLRDELSRAILGEMPEARVNGHPVERLPNTLNISFPGVRAAELLAAAPGVAASAGSACASESPEPSYVLRAMGVDRETALSSVRLSLGRFNTGEEIEEAAERLIRAARSHATA